MSFNDISPQSKNINRSSMTSGSNNINGNNNSIKSTTSNNDRRSSLNVTDTIASSLQQFQKQCMILKDKITEVKRRNKIGPADKNDIDIQMKELREFEGRLKNQIDSELKSIDNMNRTQESAQKRLALGKLQKDFERLKVSMQGLSTEVASIKVNIDSVNNNNVFTRIGNENSNSKDNIINNNDFKQPRLIQAVKGDDVDQLIMEERERDIKKINTDLQLVHEMFRDMASIVDKQGELIEEIAVTTDQSHDRAKAGLQQVQQAAANQSSCIVS